MDTNRQARKIRNTFSIRTADRHGRLQMRRPTGRQQRTMDAGNAKAMLFSIVEECPTGDPLETCPIAPLRKLSMDDRTEVLERVGQDITEQLLAFHEDCMVERRSS